MGSVRPWGSRGRRPHLVMVSGNAPPVLDSVGDFTSILLGELRRLRPDWRWTWVCRRPGRARLPLRRADGIWIIRPNALMNERGKDRMARVVRGLGPDVVHVQEQIHSLHETDVAVRIAEAVAPFPVVTTLHEFHIELESVRHTIDLVRRSRVVIAQDHRNAQRCLEHAGRAVDHVWWSLNTVPVADPSWGVRADPGVISTFGFLGALKALGVVHEAIRALRPEFPGLAWQIIGPFEPGTNPLHADLARQLDGDWVRFTGGFPRLDDRRLRSTLARSGIMVLPFIDGATVRRSTLKVAWAFGMAVVTTPPAIPEPDLIDGRNCLFVRDLEPNSWTAAIRRLLTEPELRDRLRAGGLEMAERQSARELARRHVAVYEGLLEGGMPVTRPPGPEHIDEATPPGPTSQATGSPREFR